MMFYSARKQKRSSQSTRTVVEIKRKLVQEREREREDEKYRLHTSVSVSKGDIISAVRPFEHVAHILVHLRGDGFHQNSYHWEQLVNVSVVVWVNNVLIN